VKDGGGKLFAEGWIPATRLTWIAGWRCCHSGQEADYEAFGGL